MWGKLWGGSFITENELRNLMFCAFYLSRSTRLFTQSFGDVGALGNAMGKAGAESAIEQALSR